MILKRLGMMLVGMAAATAWASSEPDCSASALTLASMDQTVVELQGLYLGASYAKLDEALSCLMRPDIRFSSGRPGASGAYWFYRKQMPAPGADPDELKRIQSWKAAVPNSDFAAFAELRFMYANAWLARGGKFANQTPEESMQLFKARLDETEAAILAARPAVRNTPLSQNLLLAVSTDGGGTSNPDDVFQEGVTKWPGYYDFYEVLLSRLVPRWGGSWGHVDYFVNYWSEQMKATEGDSMYARLYASLVKHNEYPHNTPINWPRMQSSLQDLNTRYPGLDSATLALSFACVYGTAEDQKSAAALVKKHGSHLSQSEIVLGTTPECIQAAFD